MQDDFGPEAHFRRVRASRPGAAIHRKYGGFTVATDPIPPRETPVS